MIIKPISLGMTEGTIALLLLLCPKLDILDVVPPKRPHETVVGQAIDAACSVGPENGYRASGTFRPNGNGSMTMHRDTITKKTFGMPWSPMQSLEMSSFNHLRDLSDYGEGGGDETRGLRNKYTTCIGLHSLRALLGLPSLDSFFASGVIDDTEERHRPGFGTIHVKHITLRQAFVGSDVLSSLLWACEGLKTLDIDRENPEIACTDMKT